MKQLLIPVFALTLSMSPLVAQEVQSPDAEEGFSLMEEGAKLLLRGLIQEMEPAIEELDGMADEMGKAMEQFGDQMGPAMIDLLARIDDMRHYTAPEILPNGDIIIRRSPDAPEYIPDAETGEIDL